MEVDMNYQRKSLVVKINKIELDRMEVRSVGKMLKRTKKSFRIRFDGENRDTILSRKSFPQLEQVRTRQRFDAIVTRQQDWKIFALTEVKIRKYIPKIVLERTGRKIWKHLKKQVINSEKLPKFDEKFWLQ